VLGSSSCLLALLAQEGSFFCKKRDKKLGDHERERERRRRRAVINHSANSSGA
jgi:hypothetical protein